MNRYISLICASVLLVLGATSCTTTEKKPPIGSVAVVFPSEISNTHWSEEQNVMINYFTALNLEVYYSRAADGDGALQAKQIKQMQDWGVKNMVLVSSDTYSQAIIDALDAYVAAGGRVICYDRLQQNSSSVLAYVSSSYKTIGEMQITAFDKFVQGYKIEMISGPAYDVNAKTMFESASKVFSPFLSSGTWICPSGRTTYEQTKIDDWSKDKAYEYTKALLSAHYQSKPLPDAMLVANDALAAGVVQAIKEHSPDLVKFPIITGLDNSEDAWKRIVLGEQTMTIYKNVPSATDELGAMLVKLVNNQTITSTKSVFNGSIQVPYLEISGLKAIYKQDISNQ